MQRQDRDNELGNSNQSLLAEGSAADEVPAPLTLTHLPGDALGVIASHLPPHDIAALSATSRQLHQHITNGRAKVVWHAKLAQHFPPAARLTNRCVNQADFAAAYHQHYGNLDARTCWLFTLTAEGDLTGLTEGRHLYAQPRRRGFPFRDDAAKAKLAPVSLNEMMKWHNVNNDTWNAVLIASRQSHQSILDHGYSLAQARFEELRVESVNDPIGDYGEQLIHYAAAMNQSKDTICALLESGANVNAARQDGATPLYIAMHRGHYQAALCLYANAIALREDHHYLRSVSLFGRIFTGVGKSAGEKKQAAQALWKVVKGEAGLEALKPHASALLNGRLGKITKGLGYQVQSNGNVMPQRMHKIQP